MSKELDFIDFLIAVSDFIDFLIAPVFEDMMQDFLSWGKGCDIFEEFSISPAGWLFVSFQFISLRIDQAVVDVCLLARFGRRFAFLMFGGNALFV